MDELVVLYTTWPDAETAEAFARRAVEERLAACANVMAPMRSIYRWDGEIQSEVEIPMLLKTTAAAEVVDRDGRPVPGLWAAGELTGLYYSNYTGSTSVLRGATFGRIAGREAALGGVRA